MPDQRLVTVQKVRAPSSTLNGARLRLHLGEQGYRGVIAAEAIGESAGVALAAQIVAEAGGQLYRPALVERLMARAGVKERQAGKYLGQAVQGDRLKPVKDGRQTIYQSPEVAA